MKKRTIKSLEINKKTVANFRQQNAIKGGDYSNTSCKCAYSMCDCINDDF